MNEPIPVKARSSIRLKWHHWIILILTLLPIFAVFGHLGPKLGFQKRHIAARLNLNDGSRLILLQLRNKDLIEAYTTVLYRIYPDGQVESSGIDFEDSYWWFPKLRPTPDGNSINISSLGFGHGLYDSTTKIISISWPYNRTNQAVPPPAR